MTLYLEPPNSRVLTYIWLGQTIYFSDGIVLASIPLSGTVERANGTFLPITTPLVVGSRAYVLTEFKPDEDTPETRRV